jgi:uncharacterized protein (DUF3084 family)
MAPKTSPHGSPTAAGSAVAAQVEHPYSNTEPELENLHGDLSEAWERLNLWRAELRNGASALDEQKAGLQAREAEVDAKDAALRVQLYDISRLHEQISTRERELAAKVAQLQAGEDALAVARKACDQRVDDLARRDKELKRRENALAQRWSRLSAITCPHCRKPVNIGNVSE